MVRFGSLRIRIQFRDDITTPAGLSQVDPQAAARPVFGRFPDTAAVVLVIGDQELSSVAIGPFDIDDFIGAPDGQVHQPRITRPVLSLYDTLRRLVDELEPDLTGDDAIDHHESVGLDEIIRTECATACAAVVAEGKKARTEAKRETWANFDQAALLASLVEEAVSGELSEEIWTLASPRRKLHDRTPESRRWRAFDNIAIDFEPGTTFLSHPTPSARRPCYSGSPGPCLAITPTSTPRPAFGSATRPLRPMSPLPSPTTSG